MNVSILDIPKLKELSLPMEVSFVPFQYVQTQDMQSISCLFV